MTDLSLEVEAQDSPTLADLARYTGLSWLEIAAAKTDFHMSTCPLPVWECPDCAHRLKEHRAVIAALSLDEIRAEAYERGWKTGYGQGRDDEAAGAPTPVAAALDPTPIPDGEER